MGEVDSALRAYKLAWEAGEPDADFTLAYILGDESSRHEAAVVYEQLLAAGQELAAADLARLLDADGKAGPPIVHLRWYRFSV
jgi:hypothetical protein